MRNSQFVAWIRHCIEGWLQSLWRDTPQKGQLSESCQGLSRNSQAGTDSLVQVLHKMPWNNPGQIFLFLKGWLYQTRKNWCTVLWTKFQHNFKMCNCLVQTASRWNSDKTILQRLQQSEFYMMFCSKKGLLCRSKHNFESQAASL